MRVPGKFEKPKKAKPERANMVSLGPAFGEKPRTLKGWRRYLFGKPGMEQTVNMSKFGRMWDHASVDGDALVLEPYAFGLEDVKRFLEFCEEKNLDASFSGRGKHHEDTVRIEIRLKDAVDC